MLVLVFIVAFALRFWQISSLPPAVDWDEASTAYNAYSILKTGKDEYGESFPFLLRAFDGYTPPLLTYLNIPAIAVFGLNEFAARLPNALLGSMTIIGVYLLLKQLWGSKNLAAVGALFLAISPWHVTYSRVNFFATLPIFFTVFATHFFLKGFLRKRFLLFSSAFFVLAVFSYFAAYVFVPLFAAVLALLYAKKLQFKRAVLFLAPIILAAVFILFLAEGGQARYRGVSAFGDPDLIKESTQFSMNEGILGQVVHNRRIVYAQKFLEGYFTNFRFDFLFGKSDQVARMVVPGAGFGLLYFWDLPFLILGIYFLAAKKPANWKIPLVWLILGPLAAAPTLPQMTSTRTSLMMPALVMISAYGFWYFMKVKGRLVKSLVIFLLALNFLIFSHNYFGHFAREKSADWFFGYRELFSFVNSTHSPVYFFYKQHESLDQVYMFSLFYNKIDPALWQRNGGTRLGCGATGGQFSFEKYHFIPYRCLDRPVSLDEFSSGDLIVVARNPGREPLEVIKLISGEGAFYVYWFEEVADVVAGLLGEKGL